MRFWITLAVLAQLFDAATFLVAVHKIGLWAESNPLVHWQYEWSGMEGIMVSKGIVVLLLIAAWVWKARLFRPAFVTAGVLGLLGVTTNLVFGVFA